MVRSTRLAKIRRNKAIKNRKESQKRLKKIVEDKAHFELGGHIFIQVGVRAFETKNRDSSKE